MYVRLLVVVSTSSHYHLPSYRRVRPPIRSSFNRDELLARGLWGIVEGATKPPQKPTPKIKTETAAAPVDPETPESKDPVYMSDFRRYLIQRDTYNDKVGMATAEIRRSLDPSVRRRYADKKYITAPDVLWKDIEKATTSSHYHLPSYRRVRPLIRSSFNNSVVGARLYNVVAISRGAGHAAAERDGPR
ncbi:hypothetical protein FN846DRAFT_344835 [Sphaerosporella brunnea]|uniref:Uncharacterized protein n=1 Tax=Sphaerosporella brunnea TaxID=1250544 RepID=A0A5J5EHV9_9PEZI|nr:hypothetical protein FN846DRAFT_344835 [Sphaerosporella brunnea]